MTGHDLVYLRGLIGIKLRPAGAHQNGFPPQPEGQHFTNQGVGMQDHLRTGGVAAGVGGDQPGKGACSGAMTWS